MPDETVRVQVVTGEFRYDGEHYTRGDELDVQPHTPERHPRTLTRVGDSDETASEETSSDEAEAEDGDDGPSVDDLDPHPEDLTVDQLQERIQDVDDVALLKTILGAEEDTQDRSTATDAIEARIREVLE